MDTIDSKVLLSALEIISDECLKIINKIENGEPITPYEDLYLHYSHIGFSCMNSMFRKEKQKHEK